MAANIKSVKYFYAMLEDKPGQAFRMLSKLASEEVNLLAFSVVPTGPSHTQLILYPESVEALARMAEKTGMVLTGPYHAFLINGDDELGALVEIHRKLADAHVNIVTSSGVTDGKGGYGYLLHVRPEDFSAVEGLLV